MVIGTWLGNRAVKFVRKYGLSSEVKSWFLRSGYRERGPYLVKVLNG